MQYTYNILDEVYYWMKSKKKDIEVRLLKEKSEKIQSGDYITFNNQEQIGKFIKTKIINKKIFNNVDDMLKEYNNSRMMPGHTSDELKKLLLKIYGDELEKGKLVAFVFEYICSDSDNNIIEYNDKYLDDVKDLLVELEKYILSIDKDSLDQLHPEYREKKIITDLEEVRLHNGKCYLYIENNKAIGLIMGTIPPYDEYDYLDYKCPKRGKITELIVTNKIRSKGIGQQLIDKMEEYFKAQNCEYVIVDVFAYNENGIKFYNKKEYHSRMELMIKKI